MAQLIEVEVEIDENGDIVSEVHGVKGKGCLKILGDLVKALGKSKGTPTPTKEMYETAKVPQKAR